MIDLVWKEPTHPQDYEANAQVAHPRGEDDGIELVVYSDRSGNKWAFELSDIDGNIIESSQPGEFDSMSEAKLYASEAYTDHCEES